ncbi:unnamed protein product, partial [Effrenium voratum]
PSATLGAVCALTFVLEDAGERTMEARVVSRAITKGEHFAEITALLDTGNLTTLLGPARRNRQEALKDCLELRKVVAKCLDDSKLGQAKKRKKELDDTVWTVKDLGGRLLDGAEGPPPGFKAPSWMPTSEGAPLGYVSPGKYRAPVKSAASKEDNSVYSFKTRKLVVECAESDVKEAVPAEDWESKAKVALQQAFKRFGPVLEVRVNFQSDDGEKVACVRFASAKTVELAMNKSQRGWLPVGDKHVRVRLPAAEAKAEWRVFAAPRREAPAIEALPSKKKLRPNERFASKQQTTEEEEAQNQSQAQAKPPPAPEPPFQPPEPDRPVPLALEEATSAEDREVAKGEEEIARELMSLPRKPFADQKKTLKA